MNLLMGIFTLLCIAGFAIGEHNSTKKSGTKYKLFKRQIIKVDNSKLGRQTSTAPPPPSPPPPSPSPTPSTPVPSSPTPTSTSPSPSPVPSPSPANNKHHKFDILKIQRISDF